MANTKHDVKKEGHFKCEKCPYRSKWLGNVKKHAKQVHDKIRDHECKTCGYSTFTSTILNHHIKTVHHKIRETERKFKQV